MSVTSGKRPRRPGTVFDAAFARTRNASERVELLLFYSFHETVVGSGSRCIRVKMDRNGKVVIARMPALRLKADVFRSRR